MILQIVLLFFSISYGEVQGEKVNRAELKKTILSGCTDMLKSVADKKQKVCDCIVKNFDIKANDYQLKLLAENYKPQHKDNKNEVEGSVIADFDYEVATACRENPNWRIKVEK